MRATRAGLPPSWCVAAFGHFFDAPTLAVVLVGVTVTIVWRLLAIWRGWSAPEPPGLAST